MKFLKQKITRRIAFLMACILTAICAFSVTNSMKNYDGMLNRNNDYISTDTYSYNVKRLYYNLWLVGNMYLRYLDEDGNFTGSSELKASTEENLKNLGLMDYDGNLMLSSDSDNNFYISCGKSEYSNTDKSNEEIYNEDYSLYEINGKRSYPNYFYYGLECSWYSTNYGMYYYYYGGNAVSVFDFDTTDLNYYIDDFGAKIYYKTDGTTPIPVDDYYSEYDEYNSDDDFSSDNMEKSGFYIYNQDEERWVHIISEDFIETAGNWQDITICITPVQSLIDAHEKAEVEYDKEIKSFAKSIVNMIPIAVVALMLTIFVFVADGYSVSEKKYVMKSMDKIYAEFVIAAIAGVFLGEIVLFVPEIAGEINNFLNNYANTPWYIMSLAYAIAAVMFYAFIVLLGCSVFRRLKCKSFWKTTLVGVLISKIIKFVKKVILKIKSKIVSRDMLRNDIFTKKFIRRIVIFMIIEIIMLITMMNVAYAIPTILWFNIILIVVYSFLAFRDLRALKELGEQISDMNGGDYSRRNVSESCTTYGMVNNLNNISDGIRTAVEKQIKSERMKIDLVTNVSHDLKTPLTSIISYVNLLSMEELSPEAMDYVKILEHKSERLKEIVADLFYLAKATSRTDLQSELIDAVILTGQVIGDMSDKISSYGNEVRTDISLESAPIYADGKKMYRVLQNLIDNSLKYSLDGTRIYIKLFEENSRVVIQVKNIASYEMTFSPEEITERFARGDESRTSEGNGLGLSIAKSFTEACGGEFEVSVDGDVFMASVRIPLKN